MPPTVTALDTSATSAEFYVRIGADTPDAIWVGTRDLVTAGWLNAPETWLNAPETWLNLRPRVTGRILNMSPIERALDNPLGGFLAVGSVDITLDDRDNTYSSVAGGLGDPVTIWRHDREDGVTVLELHGVLDSAVFNGDWTTTLRVSDYDPSVLDTPLPQRRATTALFGTTCPNVGAPLQKVIGRVNRVKLTYVVNNLPDSQFIYHVSEGTGYTVHRLYRDRSGTLQAMETIEYTVTDATYPDMTVLRTYKQQTVSANGGVYDLYADVSGPEEERTPAGAFAAVVGDTTWGLGQRVDWEVLGPQSVATPAGLVVDAVIGGDGQQRQGREWMRQLLMLAEGIAAYHPERGWSARWDYTEPATAWGGIAARAPFGWTMLEPGRRVFPSLGRAARNARLRYGMNPHADEYRYTTATRIVSNYFSGRTVTMGDGEDRGPADVLQDRTAADMAADRLAAALSSSQDLVEGTVVGEVGRRIQVGDLIAVDMPSLHLPALFLLNRRVTRTRKAAGRIELDHVAWNSLRYTYNAEALPDLVDDDAASETDGVPV